MRVPGGVIPVRNNASQLLGAPVHKPARLERPAAFLIQSLSGTLSVDGEQEHAAGFQDPAQLFDPEILQGLI